MAALPYLLPAAELDAEIARTIARLRSALRRGRHRRTGAWGATFPIDLLDEASGFVLALVDSLRPSDLETAWLPAGHAVATLHCGSLATLPLAYRAVFDRLDGLDACAGGPVVEEYMGLDDPGESVAVVRVYVPIDEPREAVEAVVP